MSRRAFWRLPKAELEARLRKHDRRVRFSSRNGLRRVIVDGLTAGKILKEKAGYLFNPNETGRNLRLQEVIRERFEDLRADVAIQLAEVDG